MNTQKLKLQIESVNRVNAVAGQYFDDYMKIFGSLVGQKVLKADGTILEKYSKLLPKNDLPKITSYKLSGNYSLAWVIKTFSQSDNDCVYYEIAIYIGDLDNGILTNLYEKQEYKQFDYDDLVKKIQSATDAKIFAEKLRSAVFPFEAFI